MGLAIIVAVIALALAAVVPTVKFVSPSHYQGFAEFLPLVYDCATDANPSCGPAFLGALYRLHVGEIGAPQSETAEQVAAKHLQTKHQLAGRVAIVTGSTSGIGQETARVLMKHGCHVIMPARSVEKGERVLAELQQSLAGTDAGPGTVLKMDLSDMDSVKAFADAFSQLSLPLHYLVANAGIMALPNKELSKQGHELQFASNHLGHFLLLRLLEQKLVASGTTSEPARAVFVSSAGHDWFENKGTGSVAERLREQVPPMRPYQPMLNYGFSKALNVATANEQQRRWGDTGTAVAVSVHPGIIMTNLLNSAHGLEAIFFGPLYRWAQKNIPQGASTTVHALLSGDVQSDAKRPGGAYYQMNKLSASNPAVQDPAVTAEMWRLSDALVSTYLP